MSGISGVSAAAAFHVAPTALQGGAKPASAPQSQAATDADHDGDHDTPGRIDVKA